MISRKRFASLLVLLMIVAALCAGCGDDDDDDNDAAPVGDDDDDDDDDDNDDNDDDEPTPQLQAGFARVDITPDWSIKLGGYGSFFLSEAFCRWSEGVHDPLYATALAIDDGIDEPVFLINLDVVGVVITDAFRIRDGIGEALGTTTDRVIATGTHSHHAPDTIGLWGLMIPPRSGRDEAFIDWMVDGAVEAALAAYEAQRPAVAAVATGSESRLHFNDQAAVDPEAGLDSTLTVLVFSAPDGAPIGTVMNWGCHPTVMGRHNVAISADFPGAYVRHMDEALGGVNMFVNGNLGGGVLPVNNEEDGDWGTWEEVDSFGGVLADDALALLDDAEVIDDPRLRFGQAVVYTKLTNPFFALIGQVGMIPRPIPGMGETGRTIASAFRLGSFVFAALPGEIAPEVGLTLRWQIGASHQMHANIGQDWIGYVLTKEQYRNLRYFYYSILSPGGGSAEAIYTAYDEILLQLQ